MTSRNCTKASSLPTKVKQGSPVLRGYEVDTLTLQSLRLIASPAPQDDPADEQNVQEETQLNHSPELIKRLIDLIKSL